MLKKLSWFVLLVSFVMLLAGCDNKNSRDFIEGKASELSQVYSTENLEDLFKTFPDGFEIRSTVATQESEAAPNVGYDMILRGDPMTKEIRGELSKSSIATDEKGGVKEEILYTKEIQYKDGCIQLFDTTPVGEKVPEVKHPTLLLQEFTISKESLKSLPLVRKSYSYETGVADITYKLNDEKVNQFIGVNDETTLDMSINIYYETIHKGDYSYGIEFRDKQYPYTYYSEMISKLDK